MTPAMSLRPVIIGHRGSRATAPENSIAGFELAMTDGVQAVECDVRLTGDGEIVCLHDRSLERLGGRTEPIARLTLAEVRRELLPGGGVPTLTEVLDTLHGRGAIVIELKNGGDGGPLDPTHAIARSVAALLQARREAGRSDAVLAVSSFNADTLTAFAAAAAGLAAAAAGTEADAAGFEADAAEVDAAAAGFAPLIALLGGAEHSARRTLREARARGITAVHLQYSTLLRTPLAVARARRAGISVTAWTVNDRVLARLLFGMGVSGIISDCPQRLLHLVR